MSPRERFVINDLERHTPLWHRLREHLQSELDKLRKQNDEPTWDERKTALCRGEIAALRKLLAAEKPLIFGDD